METKELIKKVRKIEIKTKGISNQVFTGSYQSAFKGKGMTFTEVREYQFGDDIRSIDWNVTARFNHPYVKIFEEERELTVMLLIDVSGSNEFGSKLRLKEEMITEIAAVLAFSAINNNDKVGVIFFSSIIEKFIPPKKGTTHILRIIRELIDFKPAQRGTDIAAALRYMRNAIKKKSIAFLISDFQDRNFEDALGIVSRKHDVVGIRVYDDLERQLPAAGVMRLKDAETGQIVWADTSSREFREQLGLHTREHEQYLQNVFRKTSVDMASIATHQDYVPPLIGLFKRRMQ
jgi:uncharacterized protein (DUF58 family)